MIKIDPEFNSLIPPLTSEEFKGLEDSIKKEGCRDAIVLWNNFIVDGHNRFRICSSHKIEFKTTTKEFKDRNEVCLWIIDNQLARRNLPDFVKGELGTKRELYNTKIGKYKMSEGGKGNLKSNYLPKHDTLKKTAESFGIKRDKYYKIKKILDSKDEEIKQKARSGEFSTNQAYKEVKQKEKEENIQQEREQDAKEGKKVTLGDGIDLRHGDFKKVLKDIPDDSLDCIITDPPYPKEFLPLWTELAEFAKKKLKDNGYLICYSGQLHMPEVLERLCKHLDYVWTFCLYHEGRTQIVNGVNVMCRWKPVFIFQKGKTKFKKVIQDYVISEQREKRGHDWQQSISAVKKFVELFTKEGDIVCDPFSGSGTTADACKELNIQFIGAEIDETSYNISKKRLSLI